MYTDSTNYALVRFTENDETSVVPVSRVKPDYCTIEEGSQCAVTWTDKKCYEAILLFSGK